MLKRFLRFIVGIITFVTIPIGVVISLIIWIFTGKFYLEPISNWIIYGEFEF